MHYSSQTSMRHKPKEPSKMEAYSEACNDSLQELTRRMTNVIFLLSWPDLFPLQKQAS